MIKNILILIIASFLGAAATIAFLTRPVTPPKQTSTASTKQLSPTPTPFSLDTPPSESLIATVATFSGEVLFTSRTATEEAQVATLSNIKQGERVETTDSSSLQITLANSQFSLAPDSSLEFIQTLPDSQVFAQAKGTIAYTTGDNTILSIRSLHTLIKLTSAAATITINDDDKTAEITLKTGSLTVAFNDTDNVSTLVTLLPGERLFYDDETRTTGIR